MNTVTLVTSWNNSNSFEMMYILNQGKSAATRNIYKTWVRNGKFWDNMVVFINDMIGSDFTEQETKGLFYALSFGAQKSWFENNTDLSDKQFEALSDWFLDTFDIGKIMARRTMLRSGNPELFRVFQEEVFKGMQTQFSISMKFDGMDIEIEIPNDHKCITKVASVIEGAYNKAWGEAFKGSKHRPRVVLLSVQIKKGEQR